MVNMVCKTYFVSYTFKDKRWATWIAEVIEKYGGKARIQAWDILPGDNFVQKMDEFIKECDIYIPIFSLDYFKSYYCNEEWAAIFSKSKAESKKMIPIRIDNVEPDGQLVSKVYIDLYGIENEASAIDKLLVGLGIKEVIRKAQGFPGERTAWNGTKFPGILPPHNNLPERNTYFTGRSETLKSIYTNFSHGNTICLKQTIAGLGGVGKTQTALEYAHRFGSKYADVIWWIIAETEMSAFNGFLSFAEIVGLIPEGLDEARKLTPEQLGKRLRDWFSGHNSWLFVFDNVEHIEVIAPYTPVMQTGHILITTRDRELMQGKPIDICFFTPEESTGFMHTRLCAYPHLIENDSILTALARRLGNFPLALEQAAAYMCRAQKSCQAYLSMLNSDGLKPLLTKLGKPTHYKCAVTETLALSLDKLSDGAKQLLYLCAYMSPDMIPLEFFKCQREQFPPPLCDELIDPYTTDDITAELLNYSLVKRDGDYLNIHRFVQEIVRELLTGADTDWLELCLDAMIAATPDEEDYSQREPRDWFAQLTTHAAAIISYAQIAYNSNVEKEKQKALLCAKIATGSDQLALYNQAWEWNQKALAIREKVLGKEHPDTATTYSSIALVYYRQGNYPKAMEWNMKTLAIREKVLGIQHPDTAFTFNNIALVHYRQGDYLKTLEWSQKALTIREEVLGKEHLDTAATYNNFASAYYRLGDYSLALEWNKKTLAIKERVLGVEHPFTATTYNTIALVYFRQGDYPKALEYHQKALVIREKVLGTEHSDTATTYNNIALVYNSLGDRLKALGFCNMALEIREKVLGKEHPFTATTYNNIAFIYYHQGNYSEALEFYNKALVIREKVLGEKHSETAVTYNNIALVYDSLGDYSQALMWNKKALDVREEVLGTEHPFTATTYNDIALVYSHQGDYPEALSWYCKSYRIRQLKLGDTHPDTVSTRENLEKCYHKANICKTGDGSVSSP